MWVRVCSVRVHGSMSVWQQRCHQPRPIWVHSPLEARGAMGGQRFGRISERRGCLCYAGFGTVWSRTGAGHIGAETPREAHVFTFPLMCWYLGRQGSSGNGSWENTESSPEEQELRVSGKLGEYCSVGVHRSRYSCRHRQKWKRLGWDHLHQNTKAHMLQKKTQFEGERSKRPRTNRRT